MFRRLGETKEDSAVDTERKSAIAEARSPARDGALLPGNENDITLLFCHGCAAVNS